MLPKISIFLTFLSLLISSQNILAQEKKVSEREFVMPGDSSIIMKKYFMVFLMTGPNRSHDDSTAKALQAGHMQHIQKMADSGKMIIAGPFENTPEGTMRGLLIFDVDTAEEAIKMAEEDPAVKAGRLRLEVLPWWTAKGNTFK